MVLPTDFEKTLCFMCLPIVSDELYPDSKLSVALVMTPLIAMMQHQVNYIGL